MKIVSILSGYPSDTLINQVSVVTFIAFLIDLLVVKICYIKKVYIENKYYKWQLKYHWLIVDLAKVIYYFLLIYSTTISITRSGQGILILLQWFLVIKLTKDLHKTLKCQ